MGPLRGLAAPPWALVPPQGPRGRVRPAEGGRRALFCWLVVSLSGRQSLHMHVHMGVWWLPAGRVRPLGALVAPLWALAPPQGPRGRIRPAMGSRRALSGWLVVSLSCIRPMQLQNRIRGSSGQERFLGSYGDSYQALWGLIVPWAGSKFGLSIKPSDSLQRVLLDRKSITAECRSKIAPGAAQGKSDFSACMAIHTKPFGG